ncbi:hypothetical protein ACE8EZ_11800 [Pantoea deleyi]|uniref:hypothetical protein n=1 Tax=Pantoea deleyi TaxID=470932 RepID=UPI0035D3EF69
MHETNLSRHDRVASLSHTGHIRQYAPADVFALRLVTPQNLSFPQILIRKTMLKIVSQKTPLAL